MYKSRAVLGDTWTPVNTKFTLIWMHLRRNPAQRVKQLDSGKPGWFPVVDKVTERKSIKESKDEN